MGYIPVFTVWKYLVSEIYQRGDIKLKSVKISVQGPFKIVLLVNSLTHAFVSWNKSDLCDGWLTLFFIFLIIFTLHWFCWLCFCNQTCIVTLLLRIRCMPHSHSSNSMLSLVYCVLVTKVSVTQHHCFAEDYLTFRHINYYVLSV